MSKYDTHPDFRENDIQVRQVFIPLQQHLGQPALPVVEAGDDVRKGDLIGEIPEGALGARIHASIDGTVQEVNDKIVISK